MAGTNIFGILPLELLKASYSKSVLSVYVALASFQGKDRQCFASLGTIAKRAGASYFCASRAISILRKGGWVNTQRCGPTASSYILTPKKDLWAKIPISFLLCSKVSKNDLLVYAALASYQSNHSTCHPLRQQIAQRAGIKNLQTVSRSISKLKKIGWVIASQQGRRANTYACLLEQVSDPSQSHFEQVNDRSQSHLEQVNDPSQSHLEQVNGRSQSHLEQVNDRSQSHLEQVNGRSQSHLEQVNGRSQSHFEQVNDRSQSHLEQVNGRSQSHFEQVYSRILDKPLLEKTSIKTSSSKSSVQHSTLGTHSSTLSNSKAIHSSILSNSKTVHSSILSKSMTAHSPILSNSRNITNKGESKQPTLIGQASVKTKTMNNQQINDNLKTLLHNNVFPSLHRQIEKGFIREKNGRFIFNSDLSQPIKTILQAYLKHKAYFIKQNNHQQICQDQSPIDHLNKHVIPKLSPYGRKELEKVKFSAKGNKLHVNISQIRPHHLILLRKSFGQNLIEDRKSAI